MNKLQLFFYWATLASEVSLFVLVSARGMRRVLPAFSVYSAAMLAGTVSIGLAYHFFGFRSPEASYLYWVVVLLYLIARSLAIVELCRYGFRAYTGIWGLSWRVLSVLAFIFLVHGAIDAWGQPNMIAIYGLTLERDFDLASLAVLAGLFAIRNYYGLFLESLQRSIAVGIGFFCGVDFINNTIVRNFYDGPLFSWFLKSRMNLWPALDPQMNRVSDLYGAVQFACTAISICVWCFALRKPLPSAQTNPALLPAEVYRELSPAINLRLGAFNDRLLELLKP